VTGDQDSTPPTGAAQQLEELLLDRTFDGVVRYSRARHPDVPAQVVEDAVLAVIARLVTNDHGPKDNIFYYLARAVDRQLASAHRRPGRHDEPLNPDKPEHQLADPAAGPEETVLRPESGRLALEYLLSLLRRWDNERMALVVELHLRAALDDEPLSPEEAAEIATGVLDEEIRPGTAAVWKHRGLSRLAAQLDPDDPLPGINDQEDQP